MAFPDQASAPFWNHRHPGHSTPTRRYRTGSQVANGGWDNQTASQAGATYRLFIDICGDLSLSEYTRQHAGRFKDLVERLPSDYGKSAKYRGLDVNAILAAYAALPVNERASVITQKTVKRHFSALSTLWLAGIARGDAKENVFSGFKFAPGRIASEQRCMWERVDLADLFSSPVWTGCQSKISRAKPGPTIIRDEKFWLPLIAVFSGLRQEEICQLHVEDIGQERNIWFFDINNRPPRKLKNTTAVRRVPIHTELINLGFLSHIDTLRQNRTARVFPAFQAGGSDDRLAHAFAKWFPRYRRDVGIKKEGLVFHSFRHTATTLMHQADVSSAVIDHITGHTTPGETARYTKRSTLEQMKAAIETIDIDFNLSGLYLTQPN
ncbi:site-specific integrase [Methylobacterium marchantiae]|uniref:Site-specific integrase n=1 Tax=Methylobacterium marchantiae TaxID=600331 RepID=A0ABW3X3Y3_9HYPH